MTSAFEKAIEKFSKGKMAVKMAEMPKPEKPKKNEVNAVDPNWIKPRLYISDELPELAKKAEIGDKVYIVCQCIISGINSTSYMEKGKAKTRNEITLIVDDMAQIS
jgi:hypothetical protein